MGRFLLKDWHVNEGLAPLIAQVKVKYPRIIVGTIGDAAHQHEVSDHNPNVAGRVNAADFMLGSSFKTSDADYLVDKIIKDSRVKYVIWKRRIWKPGIGWAPYKGTDPHTGHVHLSVLDSAYKNTTPWDITERTVVFNNVNGYLPTLLYGDHDPIMGIKYVHRLQYMLNYMHTEDVVVDGVYGPATKKVCEDVFGGNGIAVGTPQWMHLLAMFTHDPTNVPKKP